MTGPNGVIEYDNATFTRAIRTWRFTCEWLVTVKPGRTIKVEITDMSIQEASDHSCSDNYILVSKHIFFINLINKIINEILTFYIIMYFSVILCRIN